MMDSVAQEADPHPLFGVRPSSEAIRYDEVMATLVASHLSVADLARTRDRLAHGAVSNARGETPIASMNILSRIIDPSVAHVLSQREQSPRPPVLLFRWNRARVRVLRTTLWHSAPSADELNGYEVSIASDEGGKLLVGKLVKKASHLSLSSADLSWQSIVGLPHPHWRLHNRQDAGPAQALSPRVLGRTAGRVQASHPERNSGACCRCGVLLHDCGRLLTGGGTSQPSGG